MPRIGISIKLISPLTRTYSHFLSKSNAKIIFFSQIWQCFQVTNWGLLTSSLSLESYKCMSLVTLRWKTTISLIRNHPKRVIIDGRWPKNELDENDYRTIDGRSSENLPGIRESNFSTSNPSLKRGGSNQNFKHNILDFLLGWKTEREVNLRHE